MVERFLLHTCPFSLRSKYEDACMICEEGIVVVNIMTDSIDLPYSFSLLDIRASKSSSGKCWIFHIDLIWILTLFLFPSGYILYGGNDEVKVHGELFMEYRNFGKRHDGLLAALIQIKLLWDLINFT